MANGYIEDDEPLNRIQLRNTGRYIILDKEDFEVARHTHWYEWQNTIVNGVKIPITDYCNIKGQRIQTAPDLDFRRKWYA